MVDAPSRVGEGTPEPCGSKHQLEFLLRISVRAHENRITLLSSSPRILSLLDDISRWGWERGELVAATKVLLDSGEPRA